jgi:hypothetical protein
VGERFALSGDGYGRFTDGLDPKSLTAGMRFPNQKNESHTYIVLLIRRASLRWSWFAQAREFEQVLIAMGGNGGWCRTSSKVELTQLKDKKSMKPRSEITTKLIVHIVCHLTLVIYDKNAGEVPHKITIFQILTFRRCRNGLKPASRLSWIKLLSP